jgi:two-component system sensor histidine kinase UhpB
MVSETIQTVQRLTMQLRPDIINDLGIENAIEWYTRDFSLRNDVKFLIDVDYDTPISYESSLVIFRIMQESLTNISRHSSATEVGIKLYKNPENIIFRIHDNGIGISDLQQKSRRSFGIIGMKERAASIGGILEITRGKTGGTDCILRIPLHKSRKNENSDLRRS